MHNFQTHNSKPRTQNTQVPSQPETRNLPPHSQLRTQNSELTLPPPFPERVNEFGTLAVGI
ncbi:MAG: hypothetical protein CAF45_010455 [Nitrospira sp. CG24E]|nr:MAG: hypothetical protein CAF45_010455 [Nitrospira sp. CG24E]